MAGIDYELDLLSRLVSINTDVSKKTGYSECANLISKEMKAIGLNVDIYDPMAQTGDGKPRPNVVGTLDVGAKKTIGLITHYDVVPPGEGWKHNPYKLTVEGDRAYGRGAADDKSAIAASLGALRLLGKNAKYNVILATSPDEETGGVWGIGYLMREIKLKLDCGVVVDSMPNMVTIGACGRITGEIRVFGKQGHAGYNYLADNPIPKLARLLVELEGFVKQREQKLSAIDAPPMSPKKKLWGRISFTIIGGGEKENVVPAAAWTRFDLRLLPDEEALEAKSELLAYFEQAREKLGINAELTYDYEDLGFITATSTPFVKAFSEATSSVFGSPLPLAASLGGDDGKFLSERGIPVVSYGAIADDTQFHGTDEFVYLKDIASLRDVLVKLIG
jgi:succinyl-diaminopimelate desuccinylase